jgi:hypothetical protein
MKRVLVRLTVFCILSFPTAPCSIVSAQSQVTQADYERAATLRSKYQSLALNIPERATWIGNTPRFWYRKSIKDGYQFVLVDAATLVKAPAFDHERLAASLSAISGEKVSALKLPFTTINFVDGEQSIEFEANNSKWKCALSTYVCSKIGPVTQANGSVNPDHPDADDPPSEPSNDVNDGVALIEPQRPVPPATQAADNAKVSPDQKWEASIQNFNLFLRSRDKDKAAAVPLSLDGSEGNYYTLRSIVWSPDSKRLVAYRVRPGYHRQIHYIESSPTDQLQPKHSTREYAKPGDALDIAQPVLFEVESKRQLVIDPVLFPNPYSLSPAVWRSGGRAFTFEYNQRGHQVYRLIEVDSSTGQARAVISEESPTFIDYRRLVPNPRDTGKVYRYDVNDGKEIIWASERDGWNHLYPYDGVTGKVKNQITRGN